MLNKILLLVTFAADQLTKGTILYRGLSHVWPREIDFLKYDSEAFLLKRMVLQIFLFVVHGNLKLSRIYGSKRTMNKQK